MKSFKQKLIFWGNLLYKRGLLCGSSGNVSVRDGDRIWVTSHGSFLGFLDKEDIVVLDLEGHVVEGRAAPTSETPLHLGIYRRFPEVKVVLHAHSPFSVAYFERHDTFCPTTFEERLYLGIVPVVPQFTPIVTQIEPVLSALDRNDIVVLKRHGVVAIGQDFKHTFSLIELLETATKTALLTGQSPRTVKRIKAAFNLFSLDHIGALIETVNKDDLIKQFGKDTTFSFSISDGEHQIGFQFSSGRLSQIDTKNVDCLFEAPQRMWQFVFNGEMDIFAACFQKRIKFKGDFKHLISLFPIFERLFELWQEIGVVKEG